MRRVIPHSFISLNKALMLISYKLEVTPTDELPFSATSLERYKIFFLSFIRNFRDVNEINQQQLSLYENSFIARNELVHYINDFIKNLNNTIDRKEFRPSTRGYYELDHDYDILPKIVKQSDLLEWSDKIINGENKRISEGGKPLDFPSAKQIEEKRDRYINILRENKNNKEFNQIIDLIDYQELFNNGVTLIKDIWNEIEFSFRHETPSTRRNKASKWGVRYVTSTDEEAVDTFSIGSNAIFK